MAYGKPETAGSTDALATSVAGPMKAALTAKADHFWFAQPAAIVVGWLAAIEAQPLSMLIAEAAAEGKSLLPIIQLKMH